MAKDEGVIERDILVLKIQSADAEMAPFLALAGGEKVVVYRERRRQTDLREVIWISPSGLLMPFLKENREIVMSTSLCGREGRSL